MAKKPRAKKKPAGPPPPPMIDTTDPTRPKRVHVKPRTQGLDYHREAALFSPTEFTQIFGRKPTPGARWEWVPVEELERRGWQKNKDGWRKDRWSLPRGQSEKGVMIEIDHSRP